MLLPLLLPCRKNGVINASDSELEQAAGICERVAAWSTFLVFIGLAFEGWIAVKHPKFDSPLERWGSFWADVLVAVGVLGELLPSMLVRRYNTEVKRRSDEKLAEAVRRAAEAEKETASLKARFSWRQLSAEQKSAISSVLEKSTDHDAL